ncbi:aldehyde dehydrogenase family protein [Prescottella equi]|uniref:aldehyde dehydrogenase family protein n=1 Tax=Rhodococcus hoagii TaxID=43767 RepID=UPI003B008A35
MTDDTTTTSPSTMTGVAVTATARATTELDRSHLYIDGAWVEPRGGEYREVIEAATGDLLGTAALGSEGDVDAASRSARRALDEGPWSRATVTERAQAMRRFAQGLEDRANATAALASRENGMPITQSVGLNGVAPAALLRQYADLIETIPLEEARPSALGTTIVRREPVGVVGAITPWNYPQALAMFKIAPALAAGCTVVLKPPPETALDAFVLADAAAEAEIPPGVLKDTMKSSMLWRSIAET